MNIIGILCMAEGTFKGVESSIGHTAETALSESCTNWKNEGKKLESSVDADSQFKGVWQYSQLGCSASGRTHKSKLCQLNF